MLALAANVIKGPGALFLNAATDRNYQATFYQEIRASGASVDRFVAPPLSVCKAYLVVGYVDESAWKPFRIIFK